MTSAACPCPSDDTKRPPPVRSCAVGMSSCVPCTALGPWGGAAGPSNPSLSWDTLQRLHGLPHPEPTWHALCEVLSLWPYLQVWSHTCPWAGAVHWLQLSSRLQRGKDCLPLTATRAGCYLRTDLSAWHSGPLRLQTACLAVHLINILACQSNDEYSR